MVELSDPKGPYQEGISNSIFIIPGIITVVLVGFFVYKLVRSLRDKSLAREEKKKLKQQRRDKEMTKKTKKKWLQ